MPHWAMSFEIVNQKFGNPDLNPENSVIMSWKTRHQFSKNEYHYSALLKRYFD
jgi:hypothetical protein